MFVACDECTQVCIWVCGCLCVCDWGYAPCVCRYGFVNFVLTCIQVNECVCVCVWGGGGGGGGGWATRGKNTVGGPPRGANTIYLFI